MEPQNGSEIIIEVSGGMVQNVFVSRNASEINVSVLDRDLLMDTDNTEISRLENAITAYQQIY